MLCLALPMLISASAVVECFFEVPSFLSLILRECNFHLSSLFLRISLGEKALVLSFVTIKC